ncbi:NAD(P)-dependent oxidoreductase [Iamia sp. SCSIO 61187]|uniref:NAD-dependent epimerase/dehydratase family protein n=1 Tax=Iamia sp. SCSIO 61187 TaxID=2722752 RepID=UPI001C63436D|nr:NAD(P)-dependent oxidoreductase [Iamia sp. SCSIO 61187]QYG95122.1 NAD(P)-dependent oxidoreductase [Iamia sp. SCSIO 61187]
MQLTGQRIVVVGVTGRVAKPLALALAAAGNDVIGAARFTDEAARAELEAAGITCAPVDLNRGDLDALPAAADGDLVDVVLNLAVAQSGRWPVDLRINAEAAGEVLARIRPGRFLHCSTTGVYAPKGHEAMAETDALGDNHAVMMPTYSISKIAAETVVRTVGRIFDVPTTIARLNVPYGDGHGWPAFHLMMMQAGQAVPVHVDGPTEYTPIHDVDILRTLPALLDVASVPATIVNWAGSERVSVEDWCAHLGELTGLTPTFERTDRCLESVVADTTLLESLAGPSTIDWRTGFRRLVETSFPDLVAR